MSNEKVVFITASAGAIGEAQARLFSSNGYKVYLTDLNEKSVGIISKDINLNGGKTSFSKLDVTHENEWKKNLENCMKKFNRIDVLCNNAGSNFRTGFENQSFEMWNKIISIGLSGTFLGIKNVTKYMKERGGVIINLGSLASVNSSDSSPGYSAQKMGLLGLTRSAALAYAKYKIRCVMVSPGHVDTPFVRSNNEYSPNDWSTSIDNPLNYKKRLDQIPLGRFLLGPDIAKLFLFLASDDAEMITGNNILLDGGTSII
jgi:NAD(P)-dependent dehydrogenase (short-subunit alcohol dehydrogenase family)